MNGILSGPEVLSIENRAGSTLVEVAATHREKAVTSGRDGRLGACAPSMFRLDQRLENRQQDQVDGEVGDRAQLLVVEGEEVGQEDGREDRSLEPAQRTDSRAQQQIDQSD